MHSLGTSCHVYLNFIVKYNPLQGGRAHTTVPHNYGSVYTPVAYMKVRHVYTNLIINYQIIGCVQRRYDNIT